MKRKYFDKDRIYQDYPIEEVVSDLERIYFKCLREDIALLEDVMSGDPTGDNLAEFQLVLHRIKGMAGTSHSYSIHAMAYVAEKAAQDGFLECADYVAGYLLKEMKEAYKIRPSDINTSGE